MPGHRLAGAGRESFRVGRRQRVPFGHLHPDRQVGQGVVRGGLVGHHVDRYAVGEQPGEDLRGVADQAHRQGTALGLRREGAGHGVRVVGGVAVEVAVIDATDQSGLVDVDDQRHAFVHGDRQRLRPAHPAASGGEGEGAGQGASEALPGDRSERLVGALQNALGADVDPGPGGHLAVHHQAGGFEAAEFGPGRPVAHQVGVGDQHTRRPLVRPEHADRLSRLHQEGLVVGEVAQRRHDGVVGGPRPCRATGAAVHHEVLGPFGDLGIKVVHQHSQRRLGLP